MNKTILRNLLLTITIGLAAWLWLPNTAEACDAKCQCLNNTQAAYQNCIAVCNSAPCNNCSGDPGACVYDWPMTSACTGGYVVQMCFDSNTCANACAVNRDSDKTDCFFGC